MPNEWNLGIKLTHLSRDPLSILSYPSGFGGHSDVLEAFAAFSNAYFSPHVPINEDEAPTRAQCLEYMSRTPDNPI